METLSLREMAIRDKTIKEIESTLGMSIDLARGHLNALPTLITFIQTVITTGYTKEKACLARKARATLESWDSRRCSCLSVKKN